MNQTHEEMVKEFMVKHDQFKQGIPTTEIPCDVKLLRMRLIVEELGELFIAMHKGDLIGIADGLADLEYVVVGTAIAYGIPHEQVFQEVQRSNMSKSPLDSSNKGGKIEKQGYTPADVKGILVKNGALLLTPEINPV